METRGVLVGDDLLPAGFAPSPALLDGTLALDIPGSLMRFMKCMCSLLTCSRPLKVGTLPGFI